MKRFLALLMILVLSVNFVSATAFEEAIKSSTFGSAGSSQIEVNQLRYEPYPVNPGEYVRIWIKIENIGKELTKAAIFELMPSFPFTLDSSADAVREFGQLSSVPVVLEYKIRVDKNAVEGTNELKLRYKADKNTESWTYQTFQIQVANAQTDFDVVVQEYSGEDISIAIANIGKNVANSVIVKVPEQDNYKAVGTSGQMVGNLENGDYTLVGFQIAKKSGAQENTLKFQVDYTDNIGERRSLMKEVIVNGNSASSVAASGTSTTGTRTSSKNGTAATQTSVYSTWWFWTIVILAFAGYYWYKHEKKKRAIRGKQH
jgi:hypothetical protein